MNALYTLAFAALFFVNAGLAVAACVDATFGGYLPAVSLSLAPAIAYLIGRMQP